MGEEGTASATAFGRVLGAVGCKGCFHGNAIIQVGLNQLVAGASALCRGLQLLQSCPAPAAGGAGNENGYLNKCSCWLIANQRDPTQSSATAQ